MTHVKAHGAISNVACEDDMTARAIANAIKAVDRNLIFVVLANSKLVTAGEAANLPMVHEVFADRAYEDNGNRWSRASKPGAVLHDAKEIAERVVRMVQDRRGGFGHRQGHQNAHRYGLHSRRQSRARSISRAVSGRRWKEPGSRWRRSRRQLASVRFQNG